MESETETKDAIRRLMRERRKALADDERERASRIVCERLVCDAAIAGTADRSVGGAIAVYLASPEEIDLSVFIRAMLVRGATVAAPRWNGETYELARLKSLSEGDLRRGPMKILEPACVDTVEPQDVAVWIVPGLAFTMDGGRIGYGGGWYDRLLASARKDSIKIGVAHGFQAVDRLQSEPHDVLLDRVVTS